MSDIIDYAVKAIREGGPRRVLVGADGLAVSSSRARDYHGITPDIIFIRKDGWTLGTPKRWIEVAEALWEDHWEAVLLKGSYTPIPYDEWVEQGRPTQ